MRKAGSWSADDSADVSPVASPAVTSTDADVSAASGKSVSPVAESHDSATAKTSVSAELRRDKSVKRSSSRWADRPVPVLQVEFPEPWSIIADTVSGDGQTREISENLKWSSLNRRTRSWFESHYP